jgi:hypothetical protein
MVAICTARLDSKGAAFCPHTDSMWYARLKQPLCPYTACTDWSSYWKHSVLHEIRTKFSRVVSIRFSLDMVTNCFPQDQIPFPPPVTPAAASQQADQQHYEGSWKPRQNGRYSNRVSTLTSSEYRSETLPSELTKSVPWSIAVRTHQHLEI